MTTGHPQEIDASSVWPSEAVVDEILAACGPERSSYHTRSSAVFDPPAAKPILEGLLPVVRAAAGVDVEPESTYARLYHSGAELKQHIDRSPLDWTVSLMLRIDAEPTTWPLEVMDRDGGWAPMLGRAVLVNGRNTPHRRSSPYPGEQALVLMLHYREPRLGRQPRWRPMVERGLLSPAEVAAVRAAAGPTGPGLVLGKPGGVAAPTDRDSDVSWIRREQFSAIFDRAQDLAEGLVPACRELQSMQFTRYAPGQRYGWHPDCSQKLISRSRVVSMTVLLEPAALGGDFEIEPEGVYDLQPGDAILFDSRDQHRVTPAIEGVRESMVAWFQRPDEHRVVRGVLQPIDIDGLLPEFARVKPSLHGRKQAPEGCSHRVAYLDKADTSRRWLWIASRRAARSCVSACRWRRTR